MKKLFGLAAILLFAGFLNAQTVATVVNGYIQEARALLKQGKKDEAVAILKKTDAQKPVSSTDIASVTDAYFMIMNASMDATTMTSTPDFETYDTKANNLIEQSIKAKPKDALLYVIRAGHRANAARLFAGVPGASDEFIKNAWPDINKALQLQPNNKEVSKVRYLLYLLAEPKDYKKAVADLDKAIYYDSANLEVYLPVRAECFRQLKDYARLAEDLTAMMYTLKTEGLLPERAEAYYNSKNFENAMVDYDSLDRIKGRLYKDYYESYVIDLKVASCNLYLNKLDEAHNAALGVHYYAYEMPYHSLFTARRDTGAKLLQEIIKTRYNINLSIDKINESAEMAWKAGSAMAVGNKFKDDEEKNDFYRRISFLKQSLVANPYNVNALATMAQMYQRVFITDTAAMLYYKAGDLIKSSYYTREAQTLSTIVEFYRIQHDEKIAYDKALQGTNDELINACIKECNKALGTIRSQELGMANGEVQTAANALKSNDRYGFDLNVRSAISNLTVAKNSVSFYRRIIGKYYNACTDLTEKQKQEFDAISRGFDEWENGIKNMIKELKADARSALRNYNLKDLGFIKGYF